MASAARSDAVATDTRGAIFVSERSSDEVGWLLELGLTLNQSRLYLTLLGFPTSTAIQLADRSGVPRTKVYEALNTLEQLGFCAARGERVALYEPVPPEIAVTEWVQRREHERRLLAERERQLGAELVRRLPQRVEQPAEGGVPFMEALIGHERVVEVFEHLVATAVVRLDIVQAMPVFQPSDRWNLLEAQAIERGVRVRVLYTPETAEDPRRYQALLEAGGQGRVSDALVLKLALRDGEEAMVALADVASGNSECTVVRITHGDLVAPLQLMFQKEWRRGREIYSKA
jgi:sugar-specific transcriptional regulator TrmB